MTPQTPPPQNDTLTQLLALFVLVATILQRLLPSNNGKRSSDEMHALTGAIGRQDVAIDSLKIYIALLEQRLDEYGIKYDDLQE